MAGAMVTLNVLKHDWTSPARKGHSHEILREKARKSNVPHYTGLKLRSAQHAVNNGISNRSRLLLHNPTPHKFLCIKYYRIYHSLLSERQASSMSNDRDVEIIRSSG